LEHILLYATLNGLKIAMSRGHKQCVVCGGNVKTKILFSLAFSKTLRVSWDECESQIKSWGRSGPKFLQTTLFIGILYRIFSIQAFFWKVNLDPSGAADVSNDVMLAIVFPLTMNIGGMLVPAALMHGNMVIASRLLDTRPGTRFVPVRATTFAGA
jgi:hypothetical protein